MLYMPPKTKKKNQRKKHRKSIHRKEKKKMPVNYMMFTVFNAGKNTTKMS